MCTGFVKKSDGDVFFGYNLDLAEKGWNYKLYVKPDRFYVGIKVGKTVYKTHGVSSNGNFAVLPYMNDTAQGICRREKKVKRIDVLVSEFNSGKLSFDELRDVVREKEIVNAESLSMHALFANVKGDVLLVEPGLAPLTIKENYAVIGNFPLLKEVGDLSPFWYGKDRYDEAEKRLRGSETFTVKDGIELLKATRQEGEWATRVSFLYSTRENAVYYVLNCDFSAVHKQVFIAE